METALMYRFLHIVCDVPLFYIPLKEKKKEEIWLSPMTKAPTPTEIYKNQSVKNATKNSDSYLKYLLVLPND